MKKICILLVLGIHFIGAQQKMTLSECEDAFRKNNLQILAEKYNISQADADIIQAKIWDLPEFGFSANLLNPNKPVRVFHIGPSKNAQITQLFLLGGKRQKQIDFAKSNKELAQLQYNQLVVDLKTQLRETFYAIYFDQKKIQSIDNQLKYLIDLVKAYKVQTAKGNISLKDEVRLNSMVIGLNNDKVQLSNAIVAEQNALMTLTGIAEPLSPEVTNQEEQDILLAQPLMNLDGLVEETLKNNADYLFAQKAIESNKKYYTWQKSLNTPDITGGLQWNQNSGIYKNEINFMIGIPIPLWKQNQGNIQKAQMMTEQSEKNADFKKIELTAQVKAAYQTWENQYNQMKGIPQQDIDNLDTVYKGMTDNFRKGNISLIEFTDFTESYKETVLQINEIKKQILISAEELNRLAQVPVF